MNYAEEINTDHESDEENVLDVSSKSLHDINDELASISTISPLKNTKLSQSQMKRKIEQKAESMKTKILKVGSVLTSSKEPLNELSKEESHLYDLFKSVKQRLNQAQSYNEKISLLTIAPTYWSIDKTATYFNTTHYMIREARKLLRDKGLLAKRDVMASGGILSQLTKTLVVAFYQSDENSRLLPGQKDVVSIMTENGRIHMQKRLVLLNLKELHKQFKMEHPEHKIGFSAFATLCPKWCILAGASGTHTICVCTHHQNPKLKFGEFKRQT